jgi:hypothetical protein
MPHALHPIDEHALILDYEEPCFVCRKRTDRCDVVFEVFCHKKCSDFMWRDINRINYLTFRFPGGRFGAWLGRTIGRFLWWLARM